MSNSKPIFIELDGVVYISAAVVAEGLYDFNRTIGVGAKIEGITRQGPDVTNWTIRSDGTFKFRTTHADKSFSGGNVCTDKVVKKGAKIVDTISVKLDATELADDLRKAVDEAYSAAAITMIPLVGTAEPVKSLDDLAREIHDDLRTRNAFESVDARWTEAYRQANLRLSLRYALNK